MFNFGRKKQKSVPQPNSIGRRPLKLPLIDKKDVTVENIASYLKDGTPIWAWYVTSEMVGNSAKVIEKAAHGMETNALDNFEMYRVEGNYICRYYSHIMKDGMYMKLDEICELKNTNIMEIVNNDLSLAYEVYHDDIGFTENTQCYVHDVTEEMIEEYLKDHRVMYVGDEHFYRKKDYPDGPPERATEE